MGQVREAIFFNWRIGFFCYLHNSMQGLAKQSIHIMKQESPEDMAANILADYDNTTELKGLTLPSRHQLGDEIIYCMTLDKDGKPLIVSTELTLIKGVHFYPGKVKYDLEIHFPDNTATRVYNVDSVFVHDRMKETEPQPEWVDVYGNSHAFREFLTDKGITWKPNEHYTLIDSRVDLFELGQQFEKYRQSHQK